MAFLRRTLRRRLLPVAPACYNSAMAEEFFTHQFENGLMLVAQRMRQVASAAMTMALPAGASRDPVSAAGASAVACEWLLRGAGQRNSRQLNDALDSLGVSHDEHPASEHLLLSAAQLGRNLPDALAIYADIVRRPQLADATFDPCRSLSIQALDGLEDEPMTKCNLLIREKFYPRPLGRCPMGHRDDLAAMAPEAVRRHLLTHLSPRGTILAVAGAFEWPELRAIVGECFGDWMGPQPPAVNVLPAEGGRTHIVKPTAQVQITLAYPAAVTRSKDYYAARVAQMVLSGGMSSRLFTEVREKRALVYSVAARYHSLRDYAGMFVYAGTAPQRAQETLDVTVGELRRLADGVESDEMARARTQLKAALIMQGESTSARADALAGDWYHLGRLRGLEELSAAVDAVTPEQVLDYVRRHGPANMTVLTIGPEELDTSGVG